MDGVMETDGWMANKVSRWMDGVDENRWMGGWMDGLADE